MYTLTGTIIHGKGNGRKVGMPTANLMYTDGDILPERGVYGVVARVDGTRYIGVTNVGTRPSVDNDRKLTVETYIPGVDMDLYGKEMTIDFHVFLRGIRRFHSLEEVKEQVDKDAMKAGAYFFRQFPGGFANEAAFQKED